MIRPLAGALACLATLLSVAGADANLITVKPGPGTPLQDAIDAAAPGDTIKLGDGTYRESIVINKPLKMFGRVRKKSLLAQINASCLAPIALDVAADDVSLSKVSVTGGKDTAVRVDQSNRIKISKVIPVAFGAGSDAGCGTERYGFDITQSTRVRLFYGSVYGTNFGLPGSRGFLGAAIHIAGIAPDARVDVLKYFLDGHVNGIVIEDSTGPFAVKFNHFVAAASENGVLLERADFIRLEHGLVRTLNPTTPQFGIHADADSDENRFSRNVITGYATDVLDEGLSNCWRNTTFTTGSVPTTGCP